MLTDNINYKTWCCHNTPVALKNVTAFPVAVAFICSIDAQIIHVSDMKDAQDMAVSVDSTDAPVPVAAKEYSPRNVALWENKK